MKIVFTITDYETAMNIPDAAVDHTSFILEIPDEDLPRLLWEHVNNRIKGVITSQSLSITLGVEINSGTTA